MSSAMSWLSDLMRWLASWVPQMVLVTSRQRAVVFRPRDRVSEHGPGLLVYWPIIHKLTLVSMQLRTMELSAQVHGREIVQIVLSWRIADPKKALLSLNDVVATLDDLAAAALCASYLVDKPSDVIGADTAQLLRRWIEPYGLVIERVAVAQRGKALPVKQLKDWAVHESRELSGDLQ